jgi:predicted nucleic acid-binding protein
VAAVFPVVLDSCVLFPMTLRDTLLRAAEAGLYRPYWSQEILDGATRNLVVTSQMSKEQSVRLKTQIQRAFPQAMVEVPNTLIESMTNDPGDRHVLAAAVFSSASVIVTFNLKDFSEKSLAPWQIEAQHPDTFLCSLYDLFPEAVIRLIERQAKALRNPPQTVADILQILRRQVPEFVDRLGKHGGNP